MIFDAADPNLAAAVPIPQWAGQTVSSALILHAVLVDRLVLAMQADPPWAMALQKRLLIALSARKRLCSPATIRDDLMMSRGVGYAVSEHARVHAELTARFEAAPPRPSRWPALEALSLEEAIEADLAIAGLYRLRRPLPLLSLHADARAALTGAIATANAMARRHARLVERQARSRQNLAPLIAALERADSIVSSDPFNGHTARHRLRVLRGLAEEGLVQALSERVHATPFGL